MSSGYSPYGGQAPQPPKPATPPGAPTSGFLQNAPNSNVGSGGMNPGPAAAQFGTPVQQSGWTGVSSNQDPYGVHNVGFNLNDLASGTDKTGKPLYDLSREQLLGTAGTGTNVGPAGTPLFTGNSKYENPGAVDANQDSAWASQQGGVSAQNLAAQTAQTNPTDPGSSSYPAYPNSYGLGNSGGLGGAQSPSSYSQNGITVNVPDSSSRGMTAWSTLGESNARDASQGVVTPQSNSPF